MIFNNKQSGFTRTLTFKQSIVRGFKYYKNTVLMLINKTVGRRETSSQLKGQCRGFTLVETLVAITILLIVISGPLAISSSAAKSTSFSAEQVTAFFLAQEGAELAQKLRDDLVLHNPNNSLVNKRFPFTVMGGSSWSEINQSTGDYGLCYTDQGCGLVISTNASGAVDDTDLVNCDNAANSCRLYKNATAGVRDLYTYDSTGNTLSPYTRKIKFESDGATPNEIKVISTVTWRTGSQLEEQKVETVTYLFNVYGN